jgi:hypothetical protein
VWQVEHIPNEDRIFLRVHVNDVKASEGKLHPGVFREQRGSLSVDWEKYSTSEESRNRARNPAKVGIVALVTGGVRSIDDLAVLHEPDEGRNNRAHSAVHGIFDANAPNPEVRKTMIRSRLFALFNEWLLEPGAWWAGH